MWENVNEFPKTNGESTRNILLNEVIMCKSNGPFIPANDYIEFI